MRSGAGGSRARVLRAAGALFAKKGYAGTSIDEIAAKAHASPSSIYWHFEGGKADILIAVLEEAARSFTARTLFAVQGATSVGAKCDVLLTEVALQMKDSPDTLRLILQIALERAGVDAAVRRRIQKIFAGYRAATEAELLTTFPRAPHSLLETASVLMLGTFQGLFVQWQLDPGAVKLEAMIAQLRRLLAAQAGLLSAAQRRT